MASVASVTARPPGSSDDGPARLPPELLLRIFELSLRLGEAKCVPHRLVLPQEDEVFIEEEDDDDDEAEPVMGLAPADQASLRDQRRHALQLLRTCSMARRAVEPVLYERVCLALPAKAAAFAKCLAQGSVARRRRREDTYVEAECRDGSVLDHVRFAFLGSATWYAAPQRTSSPDQSGREGIGWLGDALRSNSHALSSSFPPDEDDIMRCLDAMELCSRAQEPAPPQPPRSPSSSKRGNDSSSAKAQHELMEQLGMDPLRCLRFDSLIDVGPSRGPSQHTVRVHYPPPSLSSIRELAFLTTESTGGFVLGHHISFRPAPIPSPSSPDEIDLDPQFDAGLPLAFLRVARRRQREARLRRVPKDGGERRIGRVRGSAAYDPSADGVVMGQSLSDDDEAAVGNQPADAPPAAHPPLPCSYALQTPTVNRTIVRALSHMPTLQRVSLTIYPGAVLDNDQLEDVLRHLLSRNTLPLLRSLTLRIAYDHLSVGSRIRRIDRSRILVAASRRIADPRVRIVTARREYGTTPEEVRYDVERYLRENWDYATASVRAAEL